MRGRLCAASTNEVLEADYIALDIGLWVLQRLPDPRLCREVQNAVKIVLSKEQVNDLTIREVTLNRGKPEVVKQRFQSILLETDVVIVIETVDAHNLTARLEQRLRNTGANKPFGASYQISVHVESPVSMRALKHAYTKIKC